MPQILSVLEIFLVSNLIAYTVHCIKGHSSKEKIEIMSVRSELRKFKKLDESDKKSIF
jgi:hypothetical protein